MDRRKRISLNQRYLVFVAMAFMPALSGCLWSTFHLKGEVDATKGVEDPPPKVEEEKEPSDLSVR